MVFARLAQPAGCLRQRQPVQQAARRRNDRRALHSTEVTYSVLAWVGQMKFAKVVALGGALLLLSAPAIAEESAMNTSKPPLFSWHRSLPIDPEKSEVTTFGGTEVRSLATMNNKLYAGIGYWMDNKSDDPKLPGAQVMELSMANGDWHVDLQLDDRVADGPFSGQRRYFAIANLVAVRFNTDAAGHPLKESKDMLLAGVWDRLGRLEVFAKHGDTGKWQKYVLTDSGPGRQAEIRAFALYRDKVTHVDRVFGGARINRTQPRTRIISGAYDARTGELVWETGGETWGKDSTQIYAETKGGARVTSFAECGGKLYATVYNAIYERQDGKAPSWNKIFEYEPKRPFEAASSGFRGLTAIRDPETGREVLLTALEHYPCLIFRVDPTSGKRAVEANLSAELTELWHTRVGYIIAAYNNMLRYEQDGQKKLLFGIESIVAAQSGKIKGFCDRAHYFERSANGKYLVHEIVDPAHPQAAIVSCRTMIESPFADDPKGTVYAGGFDCNSTPVHNTGWLYKGVPIAEPRAND